MRILVIVNVYDPDLGGGVLFADLCQGLSARGFEVEVRCAYPYYPEWKDKTGKNGLAISQSVEHGVLVKRHGIFIPPRPENVAQRMLYEASFFASLARDLPGPGDFDAIMTFCPLVGGVAFGAVAAKSVDCPLWLNVQDLSAEAAEAAGIVTNRSLGGLLQRVQRFLFNRADAWSTISPVMRDVLLPLARYQQPVHLIPNWLHASLARSISRAFPATAPEVPVDRHPDLEPRTTPEHRAIQEPELGLRTPGIPSLLYSGNIGGKQDLLRFCQRLSALGQPFRFRIQGDGTEGPRLRDWLAAQRDSRFSFHPLSDEDGLARALADSDLFVITEKEGAGGSFIPSKLLPALGSGTPIMAVSDPDSPLGREMRENGAGCYSGWDDLAALFEHVSNPDRLQHVLPGWRASAIERSRFFDRENNIDRFATLLNDLVRPCP